MSEPTVLPPTVLPPTVLPPTAPASDVQALLALVATVERTQRTEDVDGFLALFHPDAVWVTGGGRRLVGLPEIAAFTRSVLPGAMRDLSVTYRVAHLRFLTADVALTAVEQEYLSTDGAPLDPPQRGLPSYVWVREPDGWRLRVGQNTGV